MNNTCNFRPDYNHSISMIHENFVLYYCVFNQHNNRK